MSTAIILFAHGSRDPAWAQPFRALQGLVAARCPEASVSLAFLEWAEPPLPAAIDAAVASGASALLIVPLFLSPAGHTRRDLPALVAAARMRHPHVPMRVAATIGEIPAVLEALAGWIAAERERR